MIYPPQTRWVGAFSSIEIGIEADITPVSVLDIIAHTYTDQKGFRLLGIHSAPERSFNQALWLYQPTFGLLTVKPARIILLERWQTLLRWVWSFSMLLLASWGHVTCGLLLRVPCSLILSPSRDVAVPYQLLQHGTPVEAQASKRAKERRSGFPHS